MAVTRSGDSIVLTAANDAVTGKLCIQAMQLEHTAAANAVIQNTAGGQIGSLRTTTSVLRDFIEFPKGYIANGIKVSTLTGGTVTIFLR